MSDDVAKAILLASDRMLARMEHLIRAVESGARSLDRIANPPQVVEVEKDHQAPTFTVPEGWGGGAAAAGTTHYTDCLDEGCLGCAPPHDQRMDCGGTDRGCNVCRLHLDHKSVKHIEIIHVQHAKYNTQSDM